MFGLFKSKTVAFPEANKETFFRSWWLCHKISRAVSSHINPDEQKYWQYDDILSSIDQKLQQEALAFTMGHILQRLRNDIEKAHGWTTASWEKNISYQVLISKAFDETFKLGPQAEGAFHKLFESYYSPTYGSGYEEYWNIDDEVADFEGKTAQEVSEIIESLPSDEDNYNIDRLYVYRISQIVKVVSRDKVLENARKLYQDIGIPLYEHAFFGLPLEQIKAELKILANS